MWKEGNQYSHRSLYRQCFNAFIAFPTSYEDKKPFPRSLLVSSTGEKGVPIPYIHHVMKMIENSFPASYHIVILLQDTYIHIIIRYTPFMWYLHKIKRIYEFRYYFDINFRTEIFVCNNCNVIQSLLYKYWIKSDKIK